MEEKINKILDAILLGLEKGVELANNEVSKLINEYVIYHSIESIPIWSFGWLLFAGVCSVVAYKFRKEISKAEGAWGWVIVPLSAIWIFSISGITEGLKDIAKLQFASKAALIEKFRQK